MPGRSTGSRRQLIWSAVGFALGTLVAMQPVKPGVTLLVGIAAWWVAMLVVLVLTAKPVGARLAAVLAGLFLAVPCFMWESPLARCTLMCFMFIPVAAAAALLLHPTIPGIHARLAYLTSWCGTRPVKRCPRRFNAAALLQLVVGTFVFAAGIALANMGTAHGQWLLRWLGGGIMCLAAAEMVTAGIPLVGAAFGLVVPGLFRSPYRSASVGEFWSKRWNYGVSFAFRKLVFERLARHGAWVAILVAFGGSGIGHALLAYMALGKWTVAVLCGAFFFAQPLLIGIERLLRVRDWSAAAAHAWTLAALALTSPLFVEPLIQIVEPSWGTPDDFLWPTVVALGIVLAFSLVLTLASFPARERQLSVPA